MSTRHRELIGPQPPKYEMREPFKMKVRKPDKFPYEYEDYCEYLKRKGEAQYTEVFGKAIMAYSSNLLGLRIKVDDLRLIYPELYKIKNLSYSDGKKIYPSAFDTIGRTANLDLVCISFNDDKNRPLILGETDTIWHEWYYDPEIHERRAQQILLEVEDEGYQPDRCITYFAGKEIVVIQTVFVIDDVAICQLEIMNCTDKEKEITVICNDKRGMGLEKPLGIAPPSFRAQDERGILLIKYHSIPLLNTFSAVYSNLGSEWEIKHSPDISYVQKRKLILKPNEKKNIHFMATFGYRKDVLIDRIKKNTKNLKKAISKNRKEWNDYFNYVVPRFICSDERYTKLYYWTYHVHKAGIEDFYWNKEIPVYVPPRKGIYGGATWWDNGFHSIIEKWLDDPTIAMNNALLVNDSSSACNATPCLAYWDYYLRTGDKKFLKKTMEFLKRIDSLFEKADGNGNLLPAHTGRTWDYPHRYCEAYDSKTDRFKYPIELVDVCSLVCLHRQIMSKVAKEIGDENEAQRYKTKADKTAEVINNLMWDEETGFYYDVIEDKGKKIKGCKANSGFIPLLAKIPNKQQAKRLIAHLTNPDEFWTPLPVPTISKDSSGYTPTGYWYGCVWPPMNWQIIEGLINYEPQLAKEIIHKWVFWATVTGYPTNMENHSSLGSGQCLTMQGWGGLIADLMIRRIMGFIPRADDKLEFWPLALDQNWDYASWGNFNYKGKMIDVIWNKPGNRRNLRHAPQGYTVKVDHNIIYNTRKPEHVILSANGWKLSENKL